MCSEPCADRKREKCGGDHVWHPVIWRWHFGDYQRGMICLRCPSHTWMDERGGIWRNRSLDLNHDQWRWWLARIEGKPVTPWPMHEHNPGPFGFDCRPDTLPWMVA